MVCMVWHYLIRLSAVIEMFCKSPLSSTVTTSHMWLLSTWHVVSVTEGTCIFLNAENLFYCNNSVGFTFLIKKIFFWLHIVRDLSSLTRDWTYAPCSRSSESWPLNCQGIPLEALFLRILVKREGIMYTYSWFMLYSRN